MSHKTLIGGAAYEIAGGKTLVNGTSYSIAGGRTLVGGTGYDISFALPAAVMDLFSSGAIHCAVYANGLYVVGGYRYASSTKTACIAYAEKLNGTWTSVDVGRTGTYAYVTNIVFAGSRWVITLGRNQCSSIGVCSGTRPSSSWTWITPYTGSDSAYCNCVLYAEGYWVVGGRIEASNYRGVIWYTTDLTGGSWSETRLWYGSNSEANFVTSLAYGNGYFAAAGAAGASGSYGQLMYAASPDGTWTSANLSWQSGQDYNAIYCIAYANGYWVAGGRANPTSRNYSAMIAYSSSITGTFTAMVLWSYAKGLYNMVNGIAYANGYWVAVGQGHEGDEKPYYYYARLAYSTSPVGGWTGKALWGGSSSGEQSANCVIYGKGHWLMGGVTGGSAARVAYGKTPAELADAT